MTRKYEIWLKERIIGLGFISSFPITRTKNMQEVTTTLEFGSLVHEDFPASQPDEAMIRELMLPALMA